MVQPSPYTIFMSMLLWIVWTFLYDLSDVVPDPSEVDPVSLLPSDANLSRVKQGMSVLLSR